MTNCVRPSLHFQRSLHLLNITVIRNISKMKKSIKTIALKEKTYRRLELCKLELIRLRGNPRITFDEVISTLLDEHEKIRGDKV